MIVEIESSVNIFRQAHETKIKKLCDTF
jgi:hypothetical protein